MATLLGTIEWGEPTLPRVAGPRSARDLPV